MTPELVATRQAFGETLHKAMQKQSDVVALTADLGESLRMLGIRDEMPDRFFDIGVAEANMVGVAAGLALGGFVPVAATFGIFLTRGYDHIRMQICQNNLQAVMVGSHAGVSNAMDGGSAHALEDIAYMRALPNMTVVFPVDANQMKKAVVAVLKHKGPTYLRLYREPTPNFTNTNDPFNLNEAILHKAGKDVSIIATGPQVAFALEAAQELKTENINAEVVGVHTIQPLDTDTIVKTAKKTGRVVTVEDHSINGGLGSAVAEALSEKQPTIMRRVGVKQFGESGEYKELIRKLGIDTEGIKQSVREIIKIKK
jgi:transketolase